MTAGAARQEPFHRPALIAAHAFGVVHRNRFIGGHPDQRLQDFDQPLLDLIAIGNRVFTQHGQTLPSGSIDTSEPL